MKPHMIVALGATAAGTLLGSAAKSRATAASFFVDARAARSLTVHPSSILRAPDSAARRLAREEFVSDLKSIARKLKRTK